ncbi:SigE family RNA polymerase sigma factor [Cellulomonas sp. P24]|uniref:SigE family RNA polymerase sigma factor n=1 Tax=Cellulomonas sp. P24 TaxID=2885206 RepID=UPI00216AE805|nr:SigE family RNA polymerase sigma factor [Cellulomonas sp. P24]MCR6490895.1 SigE family RNA polymerase sigma factor [Cellulomonas sp. P24]MCR6494770.1 SigE family RNA polymerase sigma factor [Cellulomonas sp. P24]
MSVLEPDVAGRQWLPPEADDVEVVLEPARSHEQEFVDFVRSAKDPLYRMAYLLCGDPHRAEDLVQQTFERTWRSWRSARNGDPLVWSRRILANLRIDTWRRTRREVLTGTALDLADDARGERTVDSRDAVVRALLALPVKQRRIVVMRHLLELSEDEVAAELGIPVGTVKSTASRALARLRATVGTSEGMGS